MSGNLFPELDFDLNALEREVSGGDNFEISKLFLKFLRYIAAAQVHYINPEQHRFINRFVEILLERFASDKYSIPSQFHEEFILLNVTISNLVRVTPFINTDRTIAEILHHPDNAAKLLPMLSHRNNIKVDLEAVFSLFPYQASLWWGNTLSYGINSNSELIFNNRKNWVAIRGLEKNLTIFEPLTRKTLGPVLNSFFQSTYISPGADKPVHQAVNRVIQRENQSLRFPALKPDFKKIAVFSINFHKKHAVYRALAPYLYALKGFYHLTLIHFAKVSPEIEMDEDLFDEIKIPHEGEYREIAAAVKYITSGNYGIIYYPDIGISICSMMFSNFRLAPIQVTGSGHPVSSFGSEVDYFIGGREVEILEDAAKNYSEKLVVIPGIGMVPVMPDYAPVNQRKSPNAQENTINIMCNWGSNKFYYPHLLTLKEIINRSEKKLALHFPGIQTDMFNFLPFTHELKELLESKNCGILTYGQKKYKDYMAIIEGCDFALDSYHFGGYNRIIDMLICGKPVVVLEGRQSYNRAAAAILRNLDLDELVASNAAEYVEIVLRLIGELKYLEEVREKILAADLKTKVFETGNEKYFKKAVDYLIANRANANQARVVIIGED